MRYRKAIEHQLQLVQQSPHDVRLLQKAGELYQKAGEPKLAGDMFLRVAQCQLEAGFPLKAAALLKQVLKLAPQLVVARETLASTLLQLGLQVEAASQYRALLDHYRWVGAAEAVAGTLEALTRLGIPNGEPGQRE